MSVKGKRKTKKRTHSHSSGSGDESEHELFYHHNDRLRLMKEVLKILKLKKIKALAPPAIKKMEMEEINTLLLEELLGISNKRLKKIFEGQNADDESSSSDEDKMDVISLDSISDDEICFVDETKDDAKQQKEGKERKEKCRRKKHKIKKENAHSEVRIKNEVKTEKDKVEANKEKQKADKTKTSGLENEKLLSVLELLELQARARAIRSQLMLEAENKAKEAAEKLQREVQTLDDSDDEDAVIIETPEVKEIVISSSDSENEEIVTNFEVKQINHTNSDVNVIESDDNVTNVKKSVLGEDKQEKALVKKKIQKIKLIRSILVEPSSNAMTAAPSTSSTASSELSTKSSEVVVEENTNSEVNLNEIPLPLPDNKNKSLELEVTDVTQEITREGLKIVDCLSDSTEKTEEIINIDENGGAKGNNLIKDVNNEEVKQSEDVSTKNCVSNEKKDIEVKSEVKSVDTTHNLVQNEDEDDVIRLDIVEIDGMDD